jgi:membrane protein YqaA with SNARE-associated domain
MIGKEEAMSDRLRYAPCLAVLSLLLVLLVSPTSVAAQDDQPPMVSFLDDRDLTVDLGYLQEELSGQVVVMVRNNDPDQAWDVTLNLVGLVPLVGEADPNLLALLPQAPAHGSIPPLETRPLTLSFGVDQADPPQEGTYEGLLVLTGGSDVVRRKLILEVSAEPGAPAEAPEEAAIMPEQLSELTLAGVNFLPSLVSPVPPALFFLGLVLLGTWWVASRLGVGWSTGRKSALLLSGIVLVVWGGALAVLVCRDVLGPIEPRLVSVASVPLPAGEAEEQVGQVTAADGAVGLLMWAEDRLEARGIPRAGSYSGQIDLIPDDAEQGDATVTVNVWDWWPYAFLTVTLGVLVGYWIARYYKKERGREEQEVRMARLWRTISTAESLFQQANVGRPQAQYTMLDLAQVWIDDARRRLDEGDVDGATKRLDRLEAYSEAFAALREKLERLDDLHGRVRRDHEGRDFGVGPGEVDAFRAAEAALRGEPFLPLRAALEEKEDGQRKACEAEVDRVISWLVALRGVLGTIGRHLDHVAQIQTDGPGWTAARKKKLREHREGLEDVGAQALRAGKEDALPGKEDEADKIRAAIRDLELEAAAAGVGLERHELFALRSDLMIDGRLAGLVAEVDKAAGPPPRPSVSLVACQALTPGAFQRANVDDPVSLTVRVAFDRDAADQSPYEVQWDFGDGSSSAVFALSPGTVTARHQFRRPGSYTVTLRDMHGAPLWGQDVLIDRAPSRAERAWRTFQLDERRMTVISGLLAVGSGLLLLYFGSEAWGTPADYLKAFLWGSVISESAKEGAKIVANLVGRQWPLTT